MNDDALFPSGETSGELEPLLRFLHALSRFPDETPEEANLRPDNPPYALVARVLPAPLRPSPDRYRKKRDFWPTFENEQFCERGGGDALIARWCCADIDLQIVLAKGDLVLFGRSDAWILSHNGGLPGTFSELLAPALFADAREQFRVEDTVAGDPVTTLVWAGLDNGGEDAATLFGQGTWTGNVVALRVIESGEDMHAPELADRRLFIDPSVPEPYSDIARRLDETDDLSALVGLASSLAVELPANARDWETENFTDPFRFQARIRMLRKAYARLAELIRRQKQEHISWQVVLEAIPTHPLLKQEARLLLTAVSQAIPATGRVSDLSWIKELADRFDAAAVVRTVLKSVDARHGDEVRNELAAGLFRRSLERSRVRPAALILDFVNTSDVERATELALPATELRDPELNAAVARFLQRTAAHDPDGRERLVDPLLNIDFDPDAFTASWVGDAFVEIGGVQADGLLAQLADSPQSDIREIVSGLWTQRQESGGQVPKSQAPPAGREPEAENTPKLQIYAEGAWQDVEGREIVVLKGTRYEFRVVQPEGVSTQWKGQASGTGSTTSVVFDSSGQSHVVADWDGGQVSVDVACVALKVYSLEYVSATNAERYQIYDESGTAIFMGWQTPGTINNPACFKQGKQTAMRVRFTADRPLTFRTEIVFKGDVDSVDEYITGGDYRETRTTVGPTWPSPTPGALTVSKKLLAARVDYDHDVTIDWEYRRIGSSEWYDAGETDDLVYYIIYDNPKYGIVAGARGTFRRRHFTVPHIDYATDLAEDHGTPISPHEIAAEMVDERGDISINDDHTSHSRVRTMVRYFKTGDNGQCGCYASGLAYLLRCLGIRAHVLYSNLNRPLNTDADTSGIAWDVAVGRMTYVGVRWGTGNNWQGAVYLRDRGAQTICYDAQHELVKKYWELGNDEDGGRSGDGVLYDYFWRGSRRGQKVQTSTDRGPSGRRLRIIRRPNYRGN